ncbi:MAG: signal peptidase II [Gemmatimonadetes bacterium]|nr:signal peptidase II [Gemmatimonadota bacterium]
MFSTLRDRLFVSLALGVLAGDLVTKRIAEATLPLHQPQPVIGDVLRWTLTYNTGAAMNMHFGPSSRVVFSLIALVMIGIIVKMWRGLPANSTWLAAALGMIVAGAAGNLIDRLRSARGVVDFIDVGIGSARFWTFNVADSGVTVGAVILAILTWREPVAPDAVSPKDDDAPPPA